MAGFLPARMSMLPTLSAAASTSSMTPVHLNSPRRRVSHTSLLHMSSRTDAAVQILRAEALEKYTAATTLFTLMTAGVCVGQSQPESLGDVAKRNSPHQKAALVVTEDNHSSVTGTISVVGRDTTQTENSPAVAAAKTAGDNSQADAAPGERDAHGA